MLSVRQKIFLARLLNRALRQIRRLGGRGMTTICRRRAVTWELDLNEGIDLAIYLLGAYELRSLRAYAPLIRPGDTVFDIGANIGAHTLHFARLVGPAGRVFAFEPTDFAVAKLRRNLALNPGLAACVSLQQCFLVAERTDKLPSAIPASWPVGSWHDDLHWGHLGKSKALTAATATTADEFCAAAGIQRIDFVKLDVDGHEYPVLRGFRQSLERFRPPLLIEIAPFIYSGDKAGEFDDFVRLLAGLDYTFYNANTAQVVSRDPAVLRRTITRGGGINALLRPASAPA
jgi:FkbM family methyltransferase